MRLALALVAVLSLASLLPRAILVPLAQDEITFANRGLTLSLPPLLLRLPVVLACALAGCLVFIWSAEIAGWQVGACAAALLVSNHLWHIFASLALADGLLTAFSTAAVFCVFTDPWLEQRSTFWGFVASGAAAILSGGVNGILPLIVLGIYSVSAPRKYRPRPARAALAVGLPLALSAPWLVTHFGALELQTSVMTAALFYAWRATIADPILICLVLVALPTASRALLRRESPAVLLVCWIGVASLAILVWPDRHAAQLLPLIPALAILATAYTPFEGGSSKFLPALVVLSFIVKVITASAPWGLPFGGSAVLSALPRSRFKLK